MITADRTTQLSIDDCRREIERLRQQARLYEGVGENATVKVMRDRIAELEDVIAADMQTR